MDRTPGTNIWLNPGEKDELQVAKQAAERHHRRNFDWGAFLVGLATGAISTIVVTQAIEAYRKGREEKSRKA